MAPGVFWRKVSFFLKKVFENQKLYGSAVDVGKKLLIETQRLYCRAYGL